MPKKTRSGNAFFNTEGGQVHFWDERRGELDDFEQLDAHAERQVKLARTDRAHGLPVVEIANPLTQRRAGHVDDLSEILTDSHVHEEEDSIVEPVHHIPQV